MASKHRPKKRSEALETVGRFEPALLDHLAAPITDVIAEVSAASATLGRALHPRTAANLADLVRLMNTYYSNLIEGHNTRPREIERALAGQLDADRPEAAAVRGGRADGSEAAAADSQCRT